MSVNLIVAMDVNGLIGDNNSIPWKLSDDLKRFKQLTEYSIVVMGRKTHESIGKILPNRFNCVLSKNNNYESPYGPASNLFIYSGDLDPKLIINTAREVLNGGDVFIIGGAEIYKELFPYVDKIYLTVINKEFIGNTYFPEIDILNEFDINKLDIRIDDTSGLEYAYVDLIRKNKYNFTITFTDRYDSESKVLLDSFKNKITSLINYNIQKKMEEL